MSDVFPLLDCTGNRPVWLVNTISLVLMTLTNIFCLVIVQVSSILSDTPSAINFCLVDLTFCLCFFMCHFWVSTDSGLREVPAHSFDGDPRPSSIVAAFNRFNPQVFGGKACGCMEVSNGLQHWRQCVDICCYFIAWMDDCFFIVTWQSPQSICIPPPLENWFTQQLYSKGVLLMQIDVFSSWVENCCVVDISKLSDTD